jgi:ABC-type branched-subunit amino acid transport system permease subunit
MSYAIHLLTTLNLYILLAISLDLLVGYAGLLSLAHAAFFGVGAYSTAILIKQHGFPVLAAQGCGIAAAAILSAMIALPSIRVRGIYLLIVTIAVQVMFTVVAQNWTGLTGGDAGIGNIPAYSLFGYPLRGVAFLVFCTACTLVFFYGCRRLVRSPFGRLLRALRDDEVGAAALGKNVAAAKIAVFACSGAIAAFAGSLYAHYVSYVDPRSFDISVSILLLLMVMAGGAGTLIGPILGAAVLALLPEALKFLPLPPGVAAAMRQLLYGLLLILVVYFRPQGLLGAPARS